MSEPVFVVSIMCTQEQDKTRHIIGNGSQIIVKSASDMTVNQAVLAKKKALRNPDVTPPPPPRNAS